MTMTQQSYEADDVVLATSVEPIPVDSFTLLSPNAIRVYSGRMFDLANPDPGLLDINDIAHALSLICRFTGHVNEFDSVGQHSLIVSNLVPREDALAGLMHDATEAYLTDVSRPLKRMLPDYQAAEHRMWQAIAARFDLPLTLPASVKEADNVSLIWEQRDLMNGAHCSFPELAYRIPRHTLHGLPPAVIEETFLEAFYDLGGVA